MAKGTKPGKTGAGTGSGKAFLEEAEGDLEMDDLPPAKNTSPLPVPAPVFLGFVPFAVSTGQRCVPPKSLLWKVYHPYNDPVGRCCCEPGGWCDNLPCSGRKRRVSRKVRGHGVAHENNLSDICTNHNNIQSPEPGREWKIREVR